MALTLGKTKQITVKSFVVDSLVELEPLPNGQTAVKITSEIGADSAVGYYNLGATTGQDRLLQQTNDEIVLDIEEVRFEQAKLLAGRVRARKLLEGLLA